MSSSHVILVVLNKELQQAIHAKISAEISGINGAREVTAEDVRGWMSTEPQTAA